MTTPHAPEGGDVARAAEEVRAAGHSLYSQGVGDGHPMCRAYGRDYEEGKQDLRVAIDALITAARAEGATAERARLAGLASEEDARTVGEVVLSAMMYGECSCAASDNKCEHERRLDDDQTTLLARLAAARGEAVEEAIRWAWANHERFHVDSEDEVVRDALAALLPRGPGAATGTGVGNG